MELQELLRDMEAARLNREDQRDMILRLREKYLALGYSLNVLRDVLPMPDSTANDYAGRWGIASMDREEI